MNVYLISSESYKMLNAKINEIIGTSLNVVKYDLRKDNIQDVLNEAGYYSLDPEMKYLIVNIHDLLKNKAKAQDEEMPEEEEESEESDNTIKYLEKYLASPSSIATLILTTDEKLDKRKKIYKTINTKGHVIEIPTLSKLDLTKECMNELKLHKYFCSYELANYITENSFYNYDIMMQELDKIYLVVTPKSLTKEDLEGVVFESLQDNIYKYISAVMNNDLELAVKTSKDFDRLKIEPVIILIVLAKEFYILNYLKTGLSLQDLKNYYHLEDWKVSQYKDNLNKFSLEEIKKIIVKLSDYDYKYKSGQIDKSILLDLLTIDLCD